MARKEKAIKPTAPQAFIQNTQAYKVHELALQNYSVNDIAERLGVTEERVRQIMGEENRRITVAMQDMKERYQTVTMARTEYIYQRLMEVFMAQISAEPLHGPNKDLFKMITDILKFQNEVINPKHQTPVAAEDNSKNLTINQTFVAGSEFYDTALQEMQREFHGYTVHKPDEIIDIPPDPRLVELQDLASKYLPDGLPEDDDLDSLSE